MHVMRGATACAAARSVHCADVMHRTRVQQLGLASRQHEPERKEQRDPDHVANLAPDGSGARTVSQSIEAPDTFRNGESPAAEEEDRQRRE